MSQFIAIEGIDGAGKSYHVRQLAEEYQLKQDAPLFLSKDAFGQSDGSAVGDRIAAMYATTWGYPREEAIWNYSERYWLLSVLAWYELMFETQVLPALRQARPVVVDGWIYKHAARFSMSNHSDVRELAALLFSASPAADHVLLLSTATETAAQRVSDRMKPSEAGVFKTGNPEGSVEDFVAYQSATARALGAQIEGLGPQTHHITHENAKSALSKILST